MIAAAGGELGAAGVVVVVGVFWYGVITVKGGDRGVINVIGASVFSPPSILKRVESSRMGALTDGDGDSIFEIFCLFDGRDELSTLSLPSNLWTHCIHDP